MSNEIHEKEPYAKLREDKEALAVDSRDSSTIKKSVESLLRNPVIAKDIGANAYLAFGKKQPRKRYVDNSVQVYKSVL